MKALAYYRISKDTEGDALGVARQRKEVRALAKARGWELVEFDENDRSAFKKQDRPKFAEMLTALRAPDGPRIITAWANDRLYRHPQDGLDLMEAARDASAVVVTVKDGETDPRTAAGQMVMGILAQVARFESARKSERLRAKHAELSARGAWGGGPRPFGFDIVGGRKVDGKPARLVPNLREAKALRSAAERVLGGVSLHRVMTDWNAEGLITPKGRRWLGQKVRCSLLSPTVAGFRVHDGRRVTGVWEPVLTEAVHDLLVAKLSANKKPKVTATVNPRRFPLTGIVRCELCGFGMVGHTRGERRDRFYVCGSRRGCGRLRVSANPVETAVFEAVYHHWGALVADGDEPDETPIGPTAEEQALLNELHEHEAKRDALAADRERFGWTDGEYQAARSVHVEAIIALEARLTDVLMDREEPEIPLAEQFEMAEDYERRRAAGELTEAEVQRTGAWVRSMVEHVTITQGVKPAKGVARPDPSDRVRITWRQTKSAAA